MNFKRVFRGYDPDEVDKYIAESAAKEQQIRASQKERIDELSDENYALRQQVKQYQTDEQAISKSLIASQHLAQELKFDAERYSDLVLSRAKIFYATWRAYSKTLIAALSEDEVRQFNQLQKKIEDVINAYEGKDVAKEMEQASSITVPQAAPQQPTAAAKATEPHVEPQSQLEPHVVAQPEPQSHIEVHVEPEPQPHIEAHVEPEHQPEPEPHIEVHAEPEPKPEQTPQAAQPTPVTENTAAPVPPEAHREPQATVNAAPVPTTEQAQPSEPLTEEERWRQARAVVDVTPSEKTMGIYANPISKVEQASGQVIDLRELTRTDMSLEDLCAELGLIEKKSDN